MIHVADVAAGVRVLAGAVLVLSATAACGGTHLAGQVANAGDQCAAIVRQVQADQRVDVQAAENCDQQQFADLENARQAARAKGQKPPVRNSAVCTAVDALAAQGDQRLDFNLAFHCRQRERFANTVNALNGVGPANAITSLCQGAELRSRKGLAVDAFTQSFCSQEEAAATPQAQPQPQPKKPAAPAKAAAKTAGTVCAGSTVTLSGETGTPAASSNILPLGTRIKVTNLDNGRSIVVTVTEPSGSCALLNDAAFNQVHEPGKFLIRRARVERVA